MKGILKKVSGSKKTFLIYILGIWMIIGYAFLNSNLENYLKLLDKVASAGLTSSIAVSTTLIALATLSENRKLREKVLGFCTTEVPTFLFFSIGIIGYANIDVSIFTSYNNEALKEYICGSTEEFFKKLILIVSFILVTITNTFMLLNFKKISWEIYINYSMKTKSIENSKKFLNNGDICVKKNIEYDEDMVRVISSKKT